jgi:PleD family two-component response regulator/EAL domain-containing protein (putative c-di-GMP-specific phosphodiesterase class I)
MTLPPPSLHLVTSSEDGAEPVTDLPDLHPARPRAADAPARLSPVTRSSRRRSPSAAAAPAPTPASDDEAPYRVLVVEDDPSQALFAEGVLRGAGIQTHGVRDSADVMPAMKTFQPDLVLMDLHMPNLSGTQLTSLIRANPAFTHVPIVFLTGDQDPERQFEALEVGADDFLSKPIRPRHLLAAVHSRVKRARARSRQHLQMDVPDPLTGLYHRPQLLRSIATALSAGTGGGMLLVDIRHAGLLRQRYGYAGFEQLLQAAAKRVAELAAPHPCARLGDNAFLVFAPPHHPELAALARALRDGIQHTHFDYDGMPQRLDVAMGCADLNDFVASADLLDALGQAARAARTDPTGIVAHTPKPTVAQALIPALRNALSAGGLELSFQPLIAVAGGDEAQFQALLRLRDESGIVHPAGTLIPAAESAGLMPQIDRWVLEQAIGRLPRRDQHPVRLFVSQSPCTLALESHPRWVRDQLDHHGIPGDWLTIDLRLDDALLHAATMRRFIDPLREAGVRFCLSQYADGTEADALLDQLPLEYLRLSPRYSGTHSEHAPREELRRVIDRAHALGLQVIGPQVENAQGAAMLWMSGIDLIQGNLVQQANEALDFDFQHAVL